MAVKRYYWDSSCFTAFLGKEAGRYDVCKRILELAASQKIEIHTSTLTLAEVVKLKVKGATSKKLKPEQEQAIAELFNQPYIHLRDVDPKVGTLARNLIWSNGLDPKDSIHVATGITAIRGIYLDEIHAWDKDFTEINGKIKGYKIKICEPNIPSGPLFDGEDGDDEVVESKKSIS